MTKEQVLAAWGKPESKFWENIWMYSTDMNLNEYEKGQMTNAISYQILFKEGTSV